MNIEYTIWCNGQSQRANSSTELEDALINIYTILGKNAKVIISTTAR